MSSPIRILRRSAALAAGLAALLATAVGPAAADGSDDVVLRFDTAKTYTMYNADEGAKAENGDFPVPVFVMPSENGDARNVEVVVDTSGLAGVATVSGGGTCEGAGPVFTCTYGNLQNGDGESYNPFVIHGVDGVRPGDSGTVTYSATADNAAPVTGTTRMTIGGPTLSSPGREPGVSGLAPGKAATLAPRFANNTRFPTEKGVAVQVGVSDGVTLTARHSNCFYAGPAPTSAWCTFPTKAAAGAAYRTSAPLVYTVTQPERLTGEVTYTWSSAPQKPADHTVRGTGAPLTLIRTANQTFDDSHGRLAITTTVQVDYRPVTATVRGRVGDTVKVRLGLLNLGPGRIRGDEEMGRFEVVPPEGTTVTSVPYTFEGDGGEWACDRPEKPGGAFVCEIGYDRFYEVRHDGGTTAIDFHLRIDRQVPGAKGTIRTYNPFDRTPGNDIAVIPLEASPAPFYRPSRHPGLWAAIGAGAVAVLLLSVYRRRRRNATSS
ncbi:hypothetical protein JCM4814A_63390 [Streptomyces phaeofaciens JCM 4814]|uniref:Uncharacterized protein n=1 Tax=Streptomyces phaeofaciens TaxID=68254 RepID=A0A918LY29_9ACTN|nr:hypothetical protein [Streptomyces phaeofaciens]GGT72713.1 hypothetical protein GCM10010226_58440 [Streptomyces phaeofaciens]